MAALVRGDDRQILFMLSERYESHAAYQIRCRELGLTLTLEGKGRTVDNCTACGRVMSRCTKRVSLWRLKRSQYHPATCK